MRVVSDEWRRKHLSTIGGSSAAAVLGKHRFKTARNLWDDMHMVVREDRLPPRLRESDDLRRGTVFEGVARELLAEHLKVSVTAHDQEAFIHNADFPWAHALPDGWISGNQPVELKVPRPATVAKCNLEGILQEWDLQCLHTGMVCSAPVVHLGLLDPISGLLHYYPMPVDRARGDELMAAEREFYTSVMTGQPPSAEEIAVDASPAEYDVVLDQVEAVEAATAWFRLKDTLKDAEEVLDGLREKLSALASNASAFVVPGIGRFTHRWNKPARKFERDIALKHLHELLGDAFDESRYWGQQKPSRPFCGHPFRSE